MRSDENDIPSGWVATCLGDLYRFEYGKSLIKKSSLESGGYYVYGSSGIVGMHDKFLVQGPVIIVGRKGAAGSVSYSSDSCWPIDTTYYIRDNKNLYLKFSYFLLRSLNLGKLEASTAIPGLNRGHAYDEPVTLPPLSEQHRIVAKIEELFSELDKGIENLRTTQAQLKVYRQALLKHAFEGKLTAQWRKENQDKLEPAEVLLKRIQQEREQRYQQQLADWETNGKQSSKPKAPKLLPPLTAEELAELPELPEGWVYSYLADLGDLGRGKSKHRPRNDPSLFGGNYPFIQTGEIKAAKRIIRQYTQTYSDFGLLQSKLWPTGTLCITIAANIAETVFLGFDGCFPDSVVGFSGFRNLVAPEYVDFFIQAARTRIEAYAPATAQKNINLETLENLVVPYCCSDEQKKIMEVLEERFSEIDQLYQSITTSLEQAEILRQSILKKAFSGQLVPQDPNDEPASELLARIQAERVDSQDNWVVRRKGGRS
ncbi:restriction endonuclease subunit S [uncultured Nitrosomonas sp.]|uniref:restriction endonuclease subunit S n=1 Tax=uncultured Nitrosomonas sp. TaxID=156424 RepID=UPI0025FD5EB5|nr:restriction endonuclease subunit S [uncultured Nitrosomonas sp.]